MVHSSFSISFHCFITLLNVFIPFFFSPAISFFCRVFDSTCPSSTSLNLSSLLLVLFSINTTNKYKLTEILCCLDSPKCCRTHAGQWILQKQSRKLLLLEDPTSTRQFEESVQQSRDYIDRKCFNNHLVVGMEKLTQTGIYIESIDT